MKDWDKVLEFNRPQGVSEEAFTKFIQNKQTELKNIEALIEHSQGFSTDYIEENGNTQKGQGDQSPDPGAKTLKVEVDLSLIDAPPPKIDRQPTKVSKV